MFSGTDESPLGVLKEDAYTVFEKCKYVIGGSCYTNNGQKLLKWDFAGPFFISVLFPLTVYFPGFTYEVDRQNVACVSLFLFIWILPFLCGINASLLGSFVHHLSIMSAMMYLMLPIWLSTLCSKFFSIFVKILFIVPATVYSLLVCYKLSKSQTVENKNLIVFSPMLFTYLTVAITSALS